MKVTAWLPERESQLPKVAEQLLVKLRTEVGYRDRVMIAEKEGKEASE